MSGHLVRKTALVTGASSGIGYFTALGLARDGADVVLGGRDERRTREAAMSIRHACNGSVVDYIVADLSSMDEVRSFAQEYISRYSRLDILVNNVGGFYLTRQLSADGYEMTFALNHLSYFLLTALLTNLLEASAPARIINVASDAHYDARIRFNDLQMKRRYWGIAAYGQSKLANVLFTYELASRMIGTGVSANVLHPGFVRTGIGIKGVFRVLAPFVWLGFLRGMSPEDGARTSLLLASSPELEGVTGKYYSVEREVRSSRKSYDKAASEQLWEISEQLTSLC